MTPDHEPGSRVIHKVQRSVRQAETENSVHCVCSGCMKWAPPRRSGRGRCRCRCRCSCSCTCLQLQFRLQSQTSTTQKVKAKKGEAGLPLQFRGFLVVWLSTLRVFESKRKFFEKLKNLAKGDGASPCSWGGGFLFSDTPLVAAAAARCEMQAALLGCLSATSPCLGIDEIVSESAAPQFRNCTTHAALGLFWRDCALRGPFHVGSPRNPLRDKGEPGLRRPIDIHSFSFSSLSLRLSSPSVNFQPTVKGPEMRSAWAVVSSSWVWRNGTINQAAGDESQSRRE